MGKIEKFEDLCCWQEARNLVREIYLISEEGKLAKDYDTKSQIKRAALLDLKYSDAEKIEALQRKADDGKELSLALLRYLVTDNPNIKTLNYLNT